MENGPNRTISGEEGSNPVFGTSPFVRLSAGLNLGYFVVFPILGLLAPPWAFLARIRDAGRSDQSADHAMLPPLQVGGGGIVWQERGEK